MEIEKTPNPEARPESPASAEAEAAGDPADEPMFVAPEMEAVDLSIPPPEEGVFIVPADPELPDESD